jgi:hypothetical protein
MQVVNLKQVSPKAEEDAASFNKEVWFPYALQHPDPAVIQPEDADKYQDALARMLRDSMESDPDFWNA